MKPKIYVRHAIQGTENIYKGSEVFKFPEIFSPLSCKKVRDGAIEIWVLKTFGLYLRLENF